MRERERKSERESDENTHSRPESDTRMSECSFPPSKVKFEKRLFLIFHVVHDLLNHHFCESVSLRTNSFDELFLVRVNISTLLAPAREWSGEGVSLVAWV